jgi:hypothetical protein
MTEYDWENLKGYALILWSLIVVGGCLYVIGHFILKYW